MRAKVFNEEYIGGVLAEYEHLLGDSGAYARDAQRWGRAENEPHGDNVLTFAAEHFAHLDRVFEELADPQLHRNYYGTE